MYVTLILWTIGGAAVGALLGSTRSCEDGSCPLTATPWRGAAYGAAMGLFFAWSACASGSGSCPLTSCGTGLTGSRRTVAASTEHVTEIASTGKFKKDVLSRSKPSVVVFYSETCPPCIRYHPVVDETAKRFDGQARFYQVNVDEARSLVTEMSIRQIPTTLIINDGSLHQRLVGYQDRESLTQAVENSRKTTAGATDKTDGKEMKT